MQLVAAVENAGDEPKDMCEVLDRVENKGKDKGHKETVDLMNFLWKNGRGEDALKASEDEGFLNKLLADFKGGVLTAQ